MTKRRSRRWLPLAVLAAGALGLAGLGITAADDDGLVYYRTPTEAVHAEQSTGTVRIGGLVVPGSISESAEESTLLLTDGATQVEVSYPGQLPAVVREGQGAVVEGRWGSDGQLYGEELLMRHSNEYSAPEDP